MRDSVPVRRVCGQPLGKAGFSTQLVSYFHLLPENGSRSHIGTSLGMHTRARTQFTRFETCLFLFDNSAP